MKTLSPLTTRGAAACCTAGFSMLTVSFWLNDGTIRVLVALAGAALLGGLGAALVHPWLGERTWYRARYHAPYQEPLLPLSTAEGLGALAREGGVVALIWRREDSELTLFLEVPSTLDEPLRGMAPRLLPHATLEMVPAPPAVDPSGTTLYTWPLRSAQSGGVENLFDSVNLFSGTILKGDFELRLHIASGDIRIVIQGTPGEGARKAGVRPAFRPLVRVLRMLALSAKPTERPARARAEGRQGRIHLIRRREHGPGTPPLTLLRRYPFFDPWPVASSGEAMAVNMRFPLTSLPNTRRLDSRLNTVIALPDSYVFPEGEKVLLLGISTADGRCIGLPLPGDCPEGDKSTMWGQHFLVVGKPDSDRDKTLTMLSHQVVNHGCGLIFIDGGGSDARRVASHLPTGALSRRTWVDLDNPAGSLRLNLLSVPPVEGSENPAVGQAGAMACALQDTVPLLGEFLEQLGVTGWVGPSGSNIMLDWARVLLSAHHRARLSGTAEIRRAPAPHLLTLYELLGNPDALPSLAALERDEWQNPRASLRAALDEAGEAGAEGSRLVLDSLTSIEERLAATNPAEQRVISAALRDQLRSAMYHPSLHRMWSAPAHSPAELFGRTPSPVLLARLPVTGVSHLDAVAARSYSAYLLSCVVAAAHWRQRSQAAGGMAGSPLLVVLQDAATWLSGNGANPLSDHMDLLGSTGIALLAAGAELPEGAETEWLLDNTGSWWLHSLTSRDSTAVRRRLRTLGVAADVPLTAMPAGVCLLKVPGSGGPVVATAYTRAVDALTPGGSPADALLAQLASQQEPESRFLWRLTNS